MSHSPCGGTKELTVSKPVVYKCGKRGDTAKVRCPSGSRKVAHPKRKGERICVDVKSLPGPRKRTQTKRPTAKKARATKNARATKKAKSASPLTDTPLAVLIARSRSVVAASKRKRLTAKKAKKQSPKTRPAGLPRCPRGTRRNKRTGKCEQAKKGTADTRRAGPVTVVPNSTPKAERDISRAVARLVSQGDTGTPDAPVPAKALVPKIKRSLVATHSFSPAANARLAPLEAVTPYGVRGCEQSAWEYMKQKGLGAPVGRLQNLVPVIQIGTTGRGLPICEPSTKPAAQAYLLRALRSHKTIKCKNVIAPLQVASNCWFNTMFMVFFVGDKGRKFFQGFREMMIRGVRADGRQVEPPRLRQAFSTLNVCIEAALNRKGDAASVASALDTNHIIGRVYAGIPTTKRASLYALQPRDKPGNPLNYYDDIISYLGQDDLLTRRVLGGELLLGGRSGDRDRLRSLARSAPGLPDLIVVELFDGEARDAVARKLIPLSFAGNGSSRYALASAIVRDTDKRHFCALLSCGGKEVGYDGASFSRMSGFKWKTKLNTTSKWTFAGSTFDGTSTEIKWSFSGCYQLLFYFRVR